MGRDEPRGCCGRKVLNRQVFIVSYQQFVERKTAHAGNTVFKLVRSFSSGKETARVAVRDWYSNFPKTNDSKKASRSYQQNGSTSKGRC